MSIVNVEPRREAERFTLGSEKALRYASRLNIEKVIDHRWISTSSRFIFSNKRPKLLWKLGFDRVFPDVVDPSLNFIHVVEENVTSFSSEHFRTLSIRKHDLLRRMSRFSKQLHRCSGFQLDHDLFDREPVTLDDQMNVIGKDRARVDDQPALLNV